VLGLEMGADDYVVKRSVRASWSARQGAAASRKSALRAGLRRRRVRERAAADGLRHLPGVRRYQAAELALREFELLKFFVQHPMRVYTREQLLDMCGARHVRRTADRRRARASPAPAYRARMTPIGIDPHVRSVDIASTRSAWIDHRRRLIAAIESVSRRAYSWWCSPHRAASPVWVVIVIVLDLRSAIPLA